MVHYNDKLNAAPQQPAPRCPKCGSHRTEIAGMSQDSKTVHVRCAACGAMSKVPAEQSAAV
jgi:transcription elongation factor Elf1